MPLSPNDSPETEASEVDQPRQDLLDAITAELGDAVVGSHIAPGRELWVRVTAEAWSEAAAVLQGSLGYRFFDWLSAIDWMDSPYGRSMDAEVDKQLGLVETEEAESDVANPTGADGYAGGESRIQVLARVHSIEAQLGVTLKADVPDMTIGTWTKTFPGAEWHEREAWEMFGITFQDHPGLRPLYLPSDFQGNPMRKDFPLLARIIKPWPGIVDVEPFPESPEQGASTTNPEAAS